MPVLKVNGRSHDVRVADDVPLLYVLRNDLHLNAAKFGCGLAQCGACTVVVDGAPYALASPPVGAVAGADILTLEGLGTAEKPSRLQQAFIDEQAAQCGYCSSGMIMSAKALLDAKPKPAEGEIKLALDGNLCRCGVHQRIVRAVQRAAAEG